MAAIARLRVLKACQFPANEALPMRRRSVTQTPGVATRAHYSNHPISAKSSFRNSHLPPPAQTRHNSVESDMISRRGFWAESGIPREGYFDEQVSLSTLANARLNETRPKEPVATQQPVTTAFSYVSEHSSDTSKSRKCESEMAGSGNTSVFPVAEELDVREDLNAKPSPEKMHLVLENKILKGLTRSESGFIPSPSSVNTHQTMSRVDSGYSSKISRRSLPSLRSAVTDKSVMASDKMDVDATGMYAPSDKSSTRTSSMAPSQAHGRLPIHMEVPSPSTDDDVSTCPTSPTGPSPRSFSSFARGSCMRLSYLISNKSIEFRQSKSGTKSAPVPIIVTDDHAQQQLSSGPPSGGSGSKLYRFLSGSRKKEPPKVRQVRTIEREVPASPSDAEGGHSSLATGLQSTPLNRPGFRGEPRKETLHTIRSVGSGGVHNGTRRPKDETLGGLKQEVPKLSRRQSWRMAIAAMFGSRSSSISHSPAK
ncbi:hypothetical protein ACJZ2D_016487 [Fusarium nematophilum]